LLECVWSRSAQSGLADIDPLLVRFRGEADMPWPPLLYRLGANDPELTWAGSKSRSAAVQRLPPCLIGIEACASSLRFVATKTLEQQSCLMLHRTRHLFIRQQTAVINAIRAHPHGTPRQNRGPGKDDRGELDEMGFERPQSPSRAGDGVQPTR